MRVTARPHCAATSRNAAARIDSHLSQIHQHSYISDILARSNTICTFLSGPNRRSQPTAVPQISRSMCVCSAGRKGFDPSDPRQLEKYSASFFGPDESNALMHPFCMEDTSGVSQLRFLLERNTCPVFTQLLEHMHRVIHNIGSWHAWLETKCQHLVPLIGHYIDTKEITHTMLFFHPHGGLSISVLSIITSGNVYQRARTGGQASQVSATSVFCGWFTSSRTSQLYIEVESSCCASLCYLVSMSVAWNGTQTAAHQVTSQASPSPFPDALILLSSAQHHLLPALTLAYISSVPPGVSASLGSSPPAAEAGFAAQRLSDLRRPKRLPVHSYRQAGGHHSYQRASKSESPQKPLPDLLCS